MRFLDGNPTLGIACGESWLLGTHEKQSTSANASPSTPAGISRLGGHMTPHSNLMSKHRVSLLASQANVDSKRSPYTAQLAPGGQHGGALREWHGAQPLVPLPHEALHGQVQLS